MTETDELSTRIENIKRNIKEDYEKALGTLGTLKEKMNELEQRLEQKRPKEAKDEMTSLRAAINALDRFTDSEILKSKAAWKEYKELKHECETHALASLQLEELRTMCKRTEQLAADLLCYSLGLIKQKNTAKN